MYRVANCLVSILRGTTKNVYGDDVDTSTVHASGICASILETTTRAYDPDTETPRVIRTCRGVLPSDTDVVESDQVRDDTHGATYFVESVVRDNSTGRVPDLTLELRRLT